MALSQIIALCFVGFIYGIAKTGIIGLGVLTVPLLLYVFPPSEAIGLAMPMLLLADVLAVLLLRRTVNWRAFLAALPATAAGIVAGYWMLAYALGLPDGGGEVLLRRLIAGFMFVVLATGLAFRMAGGGKGNTVSGDGSGIHIPFLSVRSVFMACVCLIGGFATMISNYSGPAWVVYLMNYRFDKSHFIGTAAWIILFINALKVPFAVNLGLVNSSSLTANTYMIPFLIFGILCGKPLVSRVSQAFFDNLTQALALLGVLHLLLKS